MNIRISLSTLMIIMVVCFINTSLRAQDDDIQETASPKDPSEKPKRLRPGKLYQSGETIYAPRYGFTSVIPEGWEGALPLDTEIFLLLPSPNSTGAEIYTFASDQNDLSRLHDSWLKGVSLSESIRIKAKDIQVQGDMISSQIVPEGNEVNTGTTGFAVARCGAFGKCITSVGIGPRQTYDQMKSAVESFMTEASFTEPSNVSIYVDFDWKEFLSGKALISLSAMQGTSGTGTKENEFHLCSDGSFTGRIQKKGAMKQFNESYKGKQSGTWSTESIGETGIIKLEFKKLPAVELPISIKDEKIFVNNERYFAAVSEKCID
jgi:hypothetical protein